MKAPSKPTQKQIAEALQISPRRVTQLIKDGMPVDSIEAAQRWRQDRLAKNSTAEELRAERVKLVRAQRLRAEFENEARRGEFLPLADVKRDCLAVATIARSEMMRFAHESAPRMEGLSATAIGKILEDGMTDVLTRMCRAYDKLCSDAKIVRE